MLTDPASTKAVFTNAPELGTGDPMCARPKHMLYRPHLETGAARVGELARAPVLLPGHSLWPRSS